MNRTVVSVNYRGSKLYRTPEPILPIPQFCIYPPSLSANYPGLRSLNPVRDDFYEPDAEVHWLKHLRLIPVPTNLVECNTSHYVFWSLARHLLTIQFADPLIQRERD